MGLFGSSNDANLSEYERYLAEGAGETATVERVESIEEFLDDTEEVFHVLRVPSMKHGDPEESENSSTSTGGEVGTAAFTDERIVVKIPHRLSDDQFIIRYRNVQTVAFDTEGLFGKRQFTVTTAAEKYRLGVHYSIDDQQVRTIVDWVDEKATRASATDEDTAPARTPRERLTELESLYEDGLLSDDEYETKREEIVDDL